jgi:transposase-like protein
MNAKGAKGTPFDTTATTATITQAVRDVPAVACPHCGRPNGVIKHGTNRSGSARHRCTACSRTFTPRPRAKGAGADTLAAVARALAERLPHRAIARDLGVSFRTIRQVAAATTRGMGEGNSREEGEAPERGATNSGNAKVG